MSLSHSASTGQLVRKNKKTHRLNDTQSIRASNRGSSTSKNAKERERKWRSPNHLMPVEAAKRRGAGAKTQPSQLNNYDPSSYALKHKLQPLANKVIVARPDLRHTYSSLEVITTAFNEVVQHELTVKPQLGGMLARLRDSYITLFEQLIGQLVQIQKEYQSTNRRLARERDTAVLELTGRLKQMHERLYLVSSASLIKSEVLKMGQQNTVQLEHEIGNLRQLVSGGLTY